MKSLRSSVKKISEVIKKDVDILDSYGNIVCSSNASREGNFIESAEFKNSMLIDPKYNFYMMIEGGSDKEISLASMIVQDKIYEGTADNYQQFLINILKGSYMPTGSDEKVDGLKDKYFIAYCIKLLTSEHFDNAYSLIRNSFYGDSKKWVLPFEDKIVIVKETDFEFDEVKSDARMIKDMINTELYTDASIGVGNIYKGFMNIKKSYDEAVEAVRLGDMFSLPGKIYVINEMLIERLVSFMPFAKAEEMADGILKGNSEDIFDDEMLRTIEVFYKNNLNISDSSRILYIHRNTLLYRLEKIQKATGLDIRKFQDAVTLKISLLLKSRRQI